MPFLWIQSKVKETINNHSIDKESLRITHNEFHRIHPQRKSPKEFIKRVSHCLSLGKNASMTLEAAIALPLFLFFFVNILFFLEVIRLQSNMTIILKEVGTPLTVYGHMYQDNFEKEGEGESGIPIGIGFSYGYVSGKVQNSLQLEYQESIPIAGHGQDVQYFHSKIMGEKDLIDLVAVYGIEAPIKIVNYPKFYLFSRFYGRAFTGYDVTGGGRGEQQEEYVYITETGSAYHKRINCTHLQLSITSVNRNKLSSMRNESGEVYKPCELCGINGEKQYLFITNQGNRFHNNIQCSGLKRTVHSIPLSKVGDQSPCLRCTGGK